MKIAMFKIIIVVAVLLASCSADDEPRPIRTGMLQDPEIGNVLPPDANLGLMGTFVSFAHSLEGAAVIYVNNDGRRILRFENFTMTAGPDVYVLFSKSNNFSQANTIAISKLSAGFLNSSLDFEIPEIIDTDTHPFVLVYCVQYSTLFGYAELSE